MKEYKRIPTGKIARAMRFAKTGAKVGVNVVGHYAKNIASGKSLNDSSTRPQLHESNAKDIYGGLSELKGGALKVLQTLSMDQNLLPSAYVDRFSASQYSAPPLSFPLVERTFRRSFGKSPFEIFDNFSKKANSAASIGQVHKATLGEKTLAVKVQYPGVAQSVDSDLRIVKPFASKLFNINPVDVEYFFEEIRAKLLEETDYELELKRSLEISELCKDLDNISFPIYHPELSSKQILTMEWLEGEHLDSFFKNNEVSQEERNTLGQALWNFYDFQIHSLKQVHADPHPGNFLFSHKNGSPNIGIIDFGCVKHITQEFYDEYFRMLKSEFVKDSKTVNEVFINLGFLNEKDSTEQRKVFTELFLESIELLLRPFRKGFFDFSDQGYFKELVLMGDKLSRSKHLRESKVARGPRDALYINRSYFGLYHLLHSIKAKIKTESLYEGVIA